MAAKHLDITERSHGAGKFGAHEKQELHEKHEHLIAHALSKSGHSRSGADSHTVSRAHGDTRQTSKTAQKHLPELLIVGFEPGECLRGQASHYGKGDGFYGHERRDGSIHKPGATAAMRLAEAKNITVSVRNLATGASANLLVNDFGPRPKTKRLIDVNSSMRKTLFEKEDVAQVEVCRIK